MAFDPDAYIESKTKGFDPDTYIAGQSQVPRETARPLSPAGMQLTPEQIAQLQAMPQDVPVSDFGDITHPSQIYAKEKKLEPTIGEKALGVGETALTLGTGITGGTAGMTKGFIQQLSHEVMTGQYGTPEAANRIEKAALAGMKEWTYEPRTEVGKEYTKETGQFAGETLAPIAGLGPELSVMAQTTRPAVTAVKQAAAPVTQAKPVQIAGQIAETAGQATKDIATSAGKSLVKPIAGTAMVAKEGAKKFLDTITGEGKRQIARSMKADPYNADYARFKISGDRVVPDVKAEAAAKQGWRDGFIQSVKASTPTDKSAYKRMLNLFKLGRKNERFRQMHRPADIVGQTFSDRIDSLFNIKKKAIGELEYAAAALKGKRVDYTPAVSKFEQSLSDIGVQIAKGDEVLTVAGKPVKPDFISGGVKVYLRDSDIMGNTASRNLLKRVFDRLGDVNKTDGYALHNAKRFIDTQVQIGKQSKDGLTAKTEAIVKGLRRDINEALREVSPKYKAANVKFKESLDSLEAIQNAVGRKKDLSGANIDKALGQEARKLLSNYGNRVNMMDAINQAEGIVTKYSGKPKGDITGQIIFANELDHMFGDVASGTFRAKIRSAGETGLEAAMKSKTEVAADLVRGAYSKIKGINEKNALKAISELIESNK